MSRLDDYRRLQVSAQGLHKRGDVPFSSPSDKPKRNTTATHTGGWVGGGTAVGRGGSLKIPERKAGVGSPTRVHGKKTFANGDTYEGELTRDDNLPDGQGEYILKNGESRYEGQWRDGEMHGKGMYWWENEDGWEGTFIRGQMHGRGIFTYCQPDTRVAAVKRQAYCWHGKRICFFDELKEGRRIRIQTTSRTNVPDESSWRGATIVGYEAKGAKQEGGSGGGDPLAGKHVIMYDHTEKPKRLDLGTLGFEVVGGGAPLNRVLFGGTDSDKAGDEPYAIRPGARTQKSRHEMMAEVALIGSPKAGGAGGGVAAGRVLDDRWAGGGEEGDGGGDSRGRLGLGRNVKGNLHLEHSNG
jgi:hypothetical protein